jgi:hypothetical protein
MGEHLDALPSRSIRVLIYGLERESCTNCAQNDGIVA